MKLNLNSMAGAVGLATIYSAGINIATAAAGAGERTAVVEEIVVTAQKFEENLQKVPISVTALSSEDLDRKGIGSIADLVSVSVPGVSMMPFAGRKDTLNVTMRGVGTSDPTQATTDSGVAILVDDVYNARGAGVGLNIAEIDRIEVLRGPQGTLFGRNALGGAIRILTKEPTGKLEGNVTLGAGDYGQQAAGIHLNLPEFARLSLKIDAKQDEHDGFVDNASTASGLAKHDDFGTFKQTGYKVSALFRPVEQLKAIYSFEDGKMEGTSYYAQHLAAPASCQGGVPCSPSSALFAIPPSKRDEYTTTSWIGMYNGPAVTDSKSHRLGIDWQINDGLTLKSITTKSNVDAAVEESTLNGAYAFVNLGPTGLPAGALQPAFGTNGIAAGGLNPATMINGLSGIIPWSLVTSDSKSQEFQLLGQTSQVKWVTGVYLYEEDAEDSRVTAFSIAYTGFAGGRPINPVAINPAFLGAPTTSVTQSKVEAYAGFGQATWTPSWNEQLHMTGGLRYSHENRKFHRSLNNGVPSDIDQPTFDKGRFDPVVSVAYDLTDATNVYVRYGSAYRAGGASVRSPWTGPFANLAVYDEEVNKSIEAGVKSELFDHRLRLNAATYFTRVEGALWTVQFDSLNPSITGSINLPGTQKVTGVELETLYAATENLQLSGNVTWQHYEFAPDVAAYIAANDPSAAYEQAPFPKWSGSVAADYFLPLGFAEGNIHVDWNRSSSSAGTVRIARGNFGVPVWTNTANARLTLQDIRASAVNLKFSAYVKNFLNEHYPVFSATSGQFIPSEPRTYGVEVSASF